MMATPQPATEGSDNISTNSKICGKNENENVKKDAFFTYEEIKNVLKLSKKNNISHYNVYREEALRQLAHIKAVEEDNYEESPYNELPMHDHNILIHKILQKLYNHKTKNKKWLKTVKFYQLQLEHGIAMETREYKESPYYKAQNKKVNKLHNNISKHRASRLYEKFWGEDDGDSNCAIYDHLNLIVIYHELKEKIKTGNYLCLGHDDSLSEDDYDKPTGKNSEDSEEESEAETKEETEESEDKSDSEFYTSEPDTDCDELDKRNSTEEVEKNEQMCIENKMKEKANEQTENMEEKINLLNNEKILLEKIIREKNNEIQKHKELLDEKEENLIQKRKKQQELEETIQKVSWQNNKLQNQTKETQQRCEEHMEINKRLTEKLNRLEEKLKEKQNEITNKTTKIENLQKELQTMQKIKNNKKQLINKETITIQPKNKNKYVQTYSKKEQDTIIEQDKNETHLQKEKNEVSTRINIIKDSKQEEKEEQRSMGTINKVELKWIEEKLEKFEKLLEETSLKITNSCMDQTVMESCSSEHNNYTEAAILVKCLEGTKILEVQEIINTKLQQIEQIPIYYSKITKNRRVIIIKTQLEKQLLEIQQHIEKIEEIKNITEIQYSQQETKRIIIIAIPKEKETEQVLKLIQQHPGLTGDPYIRKHKIQQKTSSTYYQLILEMDKMSSDTLLKIGYLNVGLRNCRICLYRPVIRCANCQLYGHPAEHCKRQSICAFCAMGHKTINCANTNKQELMNCANCLNLPNYKKHTANSSQCTTFIHQIKYRKDNSSISINDISGGGWR